MIKDKSDKLLDTTVLIIYVLYLFLDVFYHVVLQVIGGILNIFLMYIFTAYFVLLYGNKVKRGISFLPFFIFLVFFVIYFQFFWNDSHIYVSLGFPFKTIVWNLVSFVPASISAVSINQKSSNKQLALLRKIFLILFIVICSASISILKEDPLASKKTATSSGNYIPFLIDYSAVYGLAIIFPILLLYAIKSKFKIISFVFLILVCFTLFMASYMIALIALGLGVISYFLLSIKNKWISYLCIAILLGIVVYFIYSNKIQEILLNLAYVVNNDLLEQRLKAIAGYLDSGSVDGAAVRFSDYALSLKQILKHPITGSIVWDNDVKLSGHSTNFDIIGGCGLIVFAFYFKYILNILKENLKNRDNLQFMAIISSFIAFMFVSSFNPIFSSVEIIFLFILAPKIFLRNNKKVVSK